MKKLYIPAFMLIAGAVSAQAGAELNASLSTLLDSYKQLQINPSAQVVTPVVSPLDLKAAARGGDNTLAVYIYVADGVTADDIAAQGFEVVDTYDNMILASGSLDDIDALANTDMVTRIEMGRVAEVKLLKSRTLVGQDKVHAGTDLPKAYKGTGVIAGIFDRGVDPNHINFYDMGFTASRVARVWKYSGSNGSGASYETPTAIAGMDTDNKADTHGTHTAGCMAGGHNLKGLTSSKTPGKFAYWKENGTTATSIMDPNPYYGMAPNATLAIGCGQLYDANIVAAIKKMTDFARTEGKPLVVNLSVGTTVGSHDDYSSFTNAVEKYTDQAIIIVAAGNEGESNVSAVKKLTSSDKTMKVFLEGTGAGSGILEAWSDSATPFTVKVGVYNLTTNSLYYTYSQTTGGTTYLTSSNYTQSGYVHDIKFDECFSTSSYFLIKTSQNTTTSGRYNLELQYKISGLKTSNLVPCLILEGSAGQRIDITHSNSSGSYALSDRGLSGWTNGGSEMSINDMACGKNVVCVGAYNSQKKWPVCGGGFYYFNGTGLEDNEIAGYSSYGTLYDGRTLPMVCAPGTGIISSLSSYNTDYLGTDTKTVPAYFKYNNRTYMWGSEAGTSMATPIVAGCVATWLEADPDLKVADVQDIIKKTADKDTYTATAGQAVRWGAGKFNSYAGLKEVLARKGIGGVGAIAVDKDKMLIANVGNNVYEITVPGANSVNAVIYNMSGAPVATANAAGTEATISAANLAKGVYILSVNNAESHRILVK